MDVREKMAELIGSTEYGNGSLVGNNSQKGFIEKIATHLIASGVTVQEWISVKEPPKEKGTYIVCTDNGGVLLGHWYGTAWNAGGGAKKHLAYWMEKPQPPKGE